MFMKKQEELRRHVLDNQMLGSITQVTGCPEEALKLCCHFKNKAPPPVPIEDSFLELPSKAACKKQARKGRPEQSVIEMAGHEEVLAGSRGTDRKEPGPKDCCRSALERFLPVVMVPVAVAAPGIE